MGAEEAGAAGDERRRHRARWYPAAGTPRRRAYEVLTARVTRLATSNSRCGVCGSCLLLVASSAWACRCPPPPDSQYAAGSSSQPRCCSSRWRGPRRDDRRRSADDAEPEAGPESATRPVPRPIPTSSRRRRSPTTATSRAGISTTRTTSSRRTRSSTRTARSRRTRARTGATTARRSGRTAANDPRPRLPSPRSRSSSDSARTTIRDGSPSRSTASSPAGRRRSAIRGRQARSPSIQAPTP